MQVKFQTRNVFSVSFYTTYCYKNELYNRSFKYLSKKKLKLFTFYKVN